MSREKITPPTRAEWIPNTFVTPNVFVDKLMPLLEPEEYVVLSYAAREIFGWHKREDRISIKQFCKGKTKKETGEIINYGTGMSIDSVRSALESLNRYGILVKVADNDPRVNEGALYSLSPDGQSVDWDGLLKRYEEKLEKNANRVRKARDNRGKKPPAFCETEGVAPTERTPSVVQNAPILSDRNTERHGLKPNLKPSIHPNESENSDTITDDLNQTGMDVWMDGLLQNPNFRFLRKCGVMNDRVAEELMILPISTLEYQWGIVKDSTTIKDKPGMLVSNLRKILKLEEAEQRAAAQRAANPEPVQAQRTAPADIHEHYNRPHFASEAEWAALGATSLYEMLEGAFLNYKGEIMFLYEQQRADFMGLPNHEEILQHFDAIRNWQPQEDWA